MRITKVILAFIFGIFLIAGGINHFYNPEFYNKMIPDYLPKLAVNYITGVTEIVIGVGLLITRYRTNAGFGAAILMCLFLPVHIWDVFRDDPAVGSSTAAMVRLSLQFVLILWAWYIGKGSVNPQ